MKTKKSNRSKSNKRKITVKLLFIFMLAGILGTYAQELTTSSSNQEKKKSRCFGIGLKLGGQNGNEIVFPSIEINYAPISQIDFFAGGIYLGDFHKSYYVGLNYLPLNEEYRVRPYIGVSYGQYRTEFLSTTLGNTFYVPLGIRFMTVNGFSIAPEIGPLINNWREPLSSEIKHKKDIFPFAGLKIGYHFK